MLIFSWVTLRRFQPLFFGLLFALSWAGSAQSQVSEGTPLPEIIEQEVVESAAIAVADLPADGQVKELGLEIPYKTVSTAPQVSDATALKVLFDGIKAEAEKGSAYAQNSLGMVYRVGYSVNRNDVLARQWFLKAAQQGHLQAMNSYAVMLELGEGGPSDFLNARQWYERAASKSDAQAQFNLARMYHMGRGGKNLQLARSWYQKARLQEQPESLFNLAILAADKNESLLSQSLLLLAAQKNVPEAHFNVGRHLARFVDDPKNIEAGFNFYRLAALNRLSVAQYNLANAINAGVGGAVDQTQAVNWYLKAAQQGDTDAMYNIAFHLESGLGVKQDFERALAWYRKSAELGNLDSAEFLALIYLQGKGVPQDLAKAFALNTRAALNGRVIAQQNLAWMYENGKGTVVSLDRAKVWYRIAAEAGLARAQQNYARLLEPSINDPSGSWNESIRWYQRAQLQGDELAALRLGQIYAQGLNGSAQPPVALRYYRKAALAGNPLIQAELAHLMFNNPREGNAGEALAWLTKAANKGDVESQLRLGLMFYQGIETVKDDQSALRWWLLAAEKDPARGNFYLGYFYENNRQVDIPRAVTYYLKSAEAGQIVAQKKLAFFLGQANSGVTNLQQARSWWQRLAQTDDALSQYNYGVYLANGWGGAQDLEQAKVWYRKAADKNLPAAAEAIRKMNASVANSPT